MPEAAIAPGADIAAPTDNPPTRIARAQSPVPASQAEERPVWLQGDHETAKAYGDFEVYRDMGKDRSLAHVARRVGKSIPYLTRLSGRYEWVARCRAFDQENTRREDEGRREAQRAAASVLADERKRRERELLDRQLDTASALLTIARRKLRPPRHLVDAAKTGDPADVAALEDWTPSAEDMRVATTGMDKSIHHSRLALGLPTQISQQDIVLKEQVTESTEISDTVVRLLEEFVCDDCKALILPHLARLRERIAGVRSQLPAGG